MTRKAMNQELDMQPPEPELERIMKLLTPSIHVHSCWEIANFPLVRH